MKHVLLLTLMLFAVHSVNAQTFNSQLAAKLQFKPDRAGSIFSTAEEVAQLYHALMSNQILNESSFTKPTTFATLGNYDLGIQLTPFYERPTSGHGGSTIGYKIRVIYDPRMKTTVVCLSNADWSAVDGITVLLYKTLIDYLPACAGIITGHDTVCQAENAVLYTVPAIVNASSYVWTVPTGATGTSTSNSISVNFSAAAISGTISVKGVNEYGEGAESSLAIKVTKVLFNQLSINNLSLPVGTIECFNATDTITVAEEDAVVFQSGSELTLIAGSCIRLLPGFRAMEGSFMDAHITNDGSYCNIAAPLTIAPPAPILAIEKASKVEKSDVATSSGLLSSHKSLKVYPNPNNGKFTLELSNTEGMTNVSVTNTLGAIIYKTVLAEPSNSEHDLSHLNNGLYFVHIQNKDERITKKMIIK